MKKISCKILLIGMFLLVLLALKLNFSTKVYAKNNFNVVQTTYNDDESSVYVTGIKDISDNISCQIGNEKIEDVSAEKENCIESNETLQTLIIMDNSLSIPKDKRDLLKKLILETVANRKEQEEFRFASYGSKVNYLTDYTKDYSVIKEAVDNMKFVKQNTYLTDVLYEIVNSFNEEKLQNYRRIIVLSDGYDNKKIGITKNELKEQLEETPYTISTVGCGSDNEELKNMFAISRMTNSKYFLVGKSNHISKIEKQLSIDNSLCKFSINLPDEYKDGSKKSIKLDLGNGKDTIITRIQTPFLEYEENLNQDNDETDKAKTDNKDKEKTKYKGKDENKEQGILNFIKNKYCDLKSKYGYKAIAAIVTLPILLIVLLVLLIKRKKNKKRKNAINNYNMQDFDSTELLNTNSDVDYDKTEIIDDDETQSIFNKGIVHTIVLTDKYDSSKTYEKNIDDSLIIGRNSDKSDLVIHNEKSVSAKHCEILIKDGEFYIRDLDSSNGTYLNDCRVLAEEKLNNSDVVKMGRAEFYISF